jgi:5-methyltetrahydropteroyltriglutamate--homocysteine methyltransferase
MKSRYRAEQVGSLLRPPELLAARQARAQGRLSLEQLRATEDRAILDALRKQRETGIDIYTDGEMRRSSWLSDMAEAVDGFVPDRVILDWKGPGAKNEASTALAAGGTLRKRRKLAAHELPFLKDAGGSARPFKITVPAASNFLVSSYKEGVTEEFYATRADLLADLVGIIRDDVMWLHAEGAPYIQFDAPYYSYYFDPACRARMRAKGLDPERELEGAIAGDNATFAGIPGDNVTFAVHICRGNSKSRWFTEGGYDAIAEKLFGSLNVDTFLLEYDTERSGSFEPLRLVPRGKTVVLGLVTSKQPELESRDSLRRRIDEAAKYIPLEDLAISTQCGFASVESGNLLTMDDQWRKLALVAETARKVWGSAQGLAAEAPHH